MASFAKLPPDKATLVVVPLGLKKTAFGVVPERVTAAERTVLGDPHPVVLVTAL
jgi:hypothetical protein